MSAFVVSRAHIDALVHTAVEGPRNERGVAPWTAWREVSWSAEQPERTWSIEEWREHRREATHENQDELGQMLLAECITSVQYRYHGECVRELPGTIAELDTWHECGIESYRYQQPARRITAVAGLKAIAAYEYQSCEHDEWEESEAFRFCHALRIALINALPGYDEAEWEISSSKVVA